MKKLPLVVVLFLAATVQSFAQNAPTKVKEAFSKKFPNAKSVKWEKENDTEWEAEFKLDGKEYSANFGADASWKETEYEIADKDLPAAVKNTLNKDFNGYEIEEVEITETPTYKAYEVEIEKGKSKLEVVIDQNGKVLKSKNKEEKEDDDK